MRAFATRIFYGLLFALPVGLVSAVWVQASVPTQADPPPSISECAECHRAFVQAWEQGAHGQAASNPTFVTAWEQQGQPESCRECHAPIDSDADGQVASGVACTVCHQPVPANHPTQPMPADRSADLCGQCHVETTFAWKVSQHRTNDLTCVDCHGQHSTTLKSGDVSTLCSRCHEERASVFVHSSHGNEGLSCADCHLGPIVWEGSEIHQVRDHSFYVNLASCERCHSDQLHAAMLQEAEPQAESSPHVVGLETAGLSMEPDPVNPMSFAVLSGLIGMAAGMILAPWLERWYKRFR